MSLALTTRAQAALGQGSGAAPRLRGLPAVLGPGKPLLRRERGGPRDTRR